MSLAGSFSGIFDAEILGFWREKLLEIFGWTEGREYSSVRGFNVEVNENKNKRKEKYAKANLCSEQVKDAEDQGTF